jgi:plasmid stabilization system protein ParE
VESLRRTARAGEGLVAIWLYIAADNPNAADRLLEEIDRTCGLPADNALLGQQLEALTEALTGEILNSRLHTRPRRRTARTCEN